MHMELAGLHKLQANSATPPQKFVHDIDSCVKIIWICQPSTQTTMV